MLCFCVGGLNMFSFVLIASAGRHAPVGFIALAGRLCEREKSTQSDKNEHYVPVVLILTSMSSWCMASVPCTLARGGTLGGKWS